jgi:hypothetical protein
MSDFLRNRIGRSLTSDLVLAGGRKRDRHCMQLTRNMKMAEKRTGFLPVRSDSFPYKGVSVLAVSKYALTGVGDRN